MTFLEKLLDYYNMDLSYYQNQIKKDIDFEFLSCFKSNKDFLNAKNIIKNSIQNNEKILIYGDYDCDGILATSIIYLTLKEDNYKSNFYIPSRKNDGYGLNLENAKKIVKAKYDLVILVDNGISLNESISYLKDNNIKVIIIDHHEYKEILPNADAIIHWEISKISNQNMSAGALSLLFSISYLDKIDYYLLTLGAITILSDLMPLKDLNRDIVRLGLNALNQFKFNKITNFFKEHKNEYSEEDLNQYFVPKVNSIGRMISDKEELRIVKYFIEDDKKDYLRLSWIDEINQKRKDLINNIDYNKYLNEDSINFVNLDIEEGLIGLVANKLMSLNKKPTFVLTLSNEEDIFKGSVRLLSNHGNLQNCFNECSNLLVNFGGHASAGGFTIKRENIENFKEKLIKYFDLPHENIKDKTINITYKDLNLENLKIIESFAPYGQDFKKPLFEIDDISTSSLTFSRDEKHIILKVGDVSKLIYFNYPKEILENKYINLSGNIEKNVFNGKISCIFKTTNFIKNE